MCYLWKSTLYNQRTMTSRSKTFCPLLNSGVFFFLAFPSDHALVRGLHGLQDVHVRAAHAEASHNCTEVSCQTALLSLNGCFSSVSFSSGSTSFPPPLAAFWSFCACLATESHWASWSPCLCQRWRPLPWATTLPWPTMSVLATAWSSLCYALFR